MGSGRIGFFSLFQRRFYSSRGRNTFSALYIDSSRRFLAWPHSADPNSTKLLFFFSELFPPFPILSGNYSPCCFSAFSSSSPSPQSLFPRWKKNFCTLAFPSLKTMESAGNNFVLLYAGNLFLRRANIIIVSIMTHRFRLPRKIWREKKMRRGNKQHSSNHLE